MALPRRRQLAGGCNNVTADQGSGFLAWLASANGFCFSSHHRLLLVDLRALNCRSKNFHKFMNVMISLYL